MWSFAPIYNVCGGTGGQAGHSRLHLCYCGVREGLDCCKTGPSQRTYFGLRRLQCTILQSACSPATPETPTQKEHTSPAPLVIRSHTEQLPTNRQQCMSLNQLILLSLPSLHRYALQPTVTVPHARRDAYGRGSLPLHKQVSDPAFPHYVSDPLPHPPWDHHGGYSSEP